MTAKETAGILALVREYYPRDIEASSIAAKVKAWHLALCEYDFDAVKNAVIGFVKQDVKGFAPTPGQLIAQITTAGAEDAEAEAQDAWTLVRKAIGNAGSNHDWLGDHLDPKSQAEHRFDELPPVVQRIVGNPQQLTRWGELATDELDTVVYSNFLRAYKGKRTSVLYSLGTGGGFTALPGMQGVVKQLGDGGDA